MLFFKRILKESGTGAPLARKERRDSQRLAVNPEFPLKTVLSFDRRGGTIAPMNIPRSSWDWPGRLINCSAVGARVQLGAGALATRGDFCDLQLNLEGRKLSMPCRITNIRVESDGVHFGLQHAIADEATAGAYRQLLGIVAMGATLKPASGKLKPDESGYVVEQYAGENSRLTIWRKPENRDVAAFEFLLTDCLVRAARGRPVEWLAGTAAATARPATPAKALEIQRLFSWVVPNLAPAVPDDVRNFLRHHVA